MNKRESREAKRRGEGIVAIRTEEQDINSVAEAKEFLTGLDRFIGKLERSMQREQEMLESFTKQKRQLEELIPELEGGE